MKTIVLALCGILLCAPLSRAEGPSSEERQPEPRSTQGQTYESPLLSLILLPVNLLIKMASLLGPDPAAKPSAPSSASPADGAK